MKFIKTNAQLLAAIAYLLVVGFFAFFGDIAVPAEQWDNVANAGWAIIPLFLCYLLFRAAQLLVALAGVADATMWAQRQDTKFAREARYASKQDHEARRG